MSWNFRALTSMISYDAISTKIKPMVLTFTCAKLWLPYQLHDLFNIPIRVKREGYFVHLGCQVQTCEHHLYRVELENRLVHVESPKEYQGGPLSKSLSSGHIAEIAITFTECTYYGL